MKANSAFCSNSLVNCRKRIKTSKDVRPYGRSNNV